MRPEGVGEAFSSESDRALGAALRGALGRPGEAEFVAAVVARARAAGVGSCGAVLLRWRRLALAAVALAALVAGVLAGTPPQPEGAGASLDDVWVADVTGSGAAAALFTARGAPDAGVLYASAESQ